MVDYSFVIFGPLTPEALLLSAGSLLLRCERTAWHVARSFSILCCAMHTVNCIVMQVSLHQVGLSLPYCWHRLFMCTSPQHCSSSLTHLLPICMQGGPDTRCRSTGSICGRSRSSVHAQYWMWCQGLADDANTDIHCSISDHCDATNTPLTN